MKIKNILIVSFTFLLISTGAYSQDKRTIETKVADLLAQFPANDFHYTDKLMSDMLSLGDEGIRRICSQIIPAGSGDDTKARFAVESFSRFLSGKGKEIQKEMWEKICISYATGQKDNGVKDFFIKQLQLIGGNATVEALKEYLHNNEICGPALAAILSAGGAAAETALAGALKNRELPCAAAVMNALASIKSQLAVNEYIAWSSDINVNIKASAFNALAQSGSPMAYSVLSKAAKDVMYRWEHTEATASLLNYADRVGQNGDLKTMDKICKLVMAKCNDRITIQNKTTALKTYVSFHGISAMKEMIKAMEHPEKSYRVAALRASLTIQGSEIVQKWIDYFPKASPDAKPELIAMFGERGDALALPLVNYSLSTQDQAIRCQAAAAVASIEGKKAIPSLIGYLSAFTGRDDQEAAKSALMSVGGSEMVAQLKPVLKNGPDVTKKSVIEMMAWTKDNEYFNEVIPFTLSADESVKAAAYAALQDLASAGDQAKLIELLSSTNKTDHVSNVQAALAVAAGKVPDPGRRSDAILKAMEGSVSREKIIPVLAGTGGREALAVVLKEFENGTAEMRDICFKTLTSWRD